MAEPRTDGRHQRAAATRERIVDAAIRCFARQGFHSTGTARIAREAGVSEGSLYNHFEDKSDLFRSVLALINRRLEEARQEGTVPGCSEADHLIRGCANIERYLGENHDVAAILMREPRDRAASDLWKDFIDSHIGYQHERIRSLLREMGLDLETGEIDALTLAFVGGLDTQIALWSIGGFQGRIEPGPERFARIFVSLVERMAGKGGPQ